MEKQISFKKDLTEWPDIDPECPAGFRDSLELIEITVTQRDADAIWRLVQLFQSGTATRENILALAPGADWLIIK